MRAKLIKGKNTNALTLMRGIVRHEGLMGLNRGISAAVIGSSLYGFIYFSLYKSLKDMLREDFKEKKTQLFLISSIVT